MKEQCFINGLSAVKVFSELILCHRNCGGERYRETERDTHRETDKDRQRVGLL